ncbi:RAMP superfamily CRISPR-associated protein [Anthocerotibacter panamensis]|uniref:RAMP superfamily CRISPR-associated protein n=1 Tax=Anthocerotibacter panamensis TaxID=2857077 RepID=UPI001C405E4D|nr:RAMP superfamily CRISPR-associated protein [Anthocerotibacter panamensis]
MHKRLVNQCTIDITLVPNGPILIKAGKEGADPTKPDMEFVETYHQGGRTIYLPGSSLKGAIRAHAERIVRTVGQDRRDANRPGQLWASDPLSTDAHNNPNLYLEKWKKQNKNHHNPGPELYKQSCFVSQMFGNTSLASRIRIEDAYPDPNAPLKIEERNGVAIDRVYGSVAVGPFNYQVCTAGAFRTKIHLKNFALPQLGLIGLVLRDLNDGWFGLGFAKSRGLGLVEVQLNAAVVQYPGCVLREDGCISGIGSEVSWARNMLLGAGMFLSDKEREPYGFPANDCQEVPVVAGVMPLGFGVQLTWQGAEQVPNLFTRAVDAWKQVITGAVR